MCPKISGKPIQLTCSEPALPEFPDLLFGSSIDNDISFFDATAYLQNKGLSVTVTDFFQKYEAPIEALMSAYGMEADQICQFNHEGHYLIDGNFAYLFISFVEPDFLAYMCDRIHELFTNGFCISDTYLVQVAKSRLTKNVLETILENGQS